MLFAIERPSIRFLSTILLRISVSIEQRKRGTVTDAICQSCRLKYIPWKKLTIGDFDQFNTVDQDDSIGP